MNLKSYPAVTADTEVTGPMIAYRAELVSYLADRKSIGERFFTDAAAAEEICDLATQFASTAREQNAAQAAFKNQIRTAARTRTEAINAMGMPPDMPADN